jgi:4-hydroxybenzoate polyprenyltransferase
MSTSVYHINKGINRAIEFKGLKAQYIWYLGGGILALLILFAILYICGISPFICLAIILIAGSALFIQIYKLSHQYGEHGMMKALAKRSIPHVIKVYSRRTFLDLTVDRQLVTHNN